MAKISTYRGAAMQFAHKTPSFLALAVMAAFSGSGVDAATLYGVGELENTSRSLPYVVGDGEVDPEFQVLVENSGSGSSFWAGSDPASAAAYLASIPEGEERDAVIATYILSITIGSSETISGVRDSALRMAMQRWLDLSESGGPDPETDLRDRFRDGEQRRGGIAEESTGQTSDLTVIPEPSTCLLGGLGALGLLRRRR